MAPNDEQGRSENSSTEISFPKKTIFNSTNRSSNSTESKLEKETLKETENVAASPLDKDIPFDDNSFFTFGYESLVKSGDDKWKKSLENPIALKNFQEKVLGIEYIVDEENTGTRKNKRVKDMKWVPVEPPGKKRKVEQTCVSHSVEQDHIKYERYNVYFDDCSEHLRENGMNFNSVDNFNDWFHYEWEAHLYGIRNLVQQNIYREEMSKYEKAKTTKNMD